MGRRSHCGRTSSHARSDALNDANFAARCASRRGPRSAASARRARPDRIRPGPSSASVNTTTQATSRSKRSEPRVRPRGACARGTASSFRRGIESLQNVIALRH
eukprot:2878179-Prymnesium_polylepis.1